ncbi:MAG: flavodoxin [Prevotellaceae bacterium]|nr:flavodoxin [Prevotellaceae bacterium]
MKDKKSLVVFFSRAGENYNVGNISKGNTHIVADIIAEKTGADIFQIVPVTPYPEEYTPCIEQANREKNSNARPAIKGDVNVEEYDIVYLGYPNWWSEMPMAVYTFIEKHDWNGKIVRPFCTHEGSGLSGTENKLRQACKGATIEKGLAITGSVAQNTPDKAEADVKRWIERFE